MKEENWMRGWREMWKEIDEKIFHIQPNKTERKQMKDEKEKSTKTLKCYDRKCRDCVCCGAVCDAPRCPSDGGIDSSEAGPVGHPFEEGADPVNHPSHYTEGFKTRPVECIDITRHLGFTVGNAFKYVWRAGKKGDIVEDLAKARWYLEAAAEQGRPSRGYDAARAVFELCLPPGAAENRQERFRYKALRCILQDEYADAASTLGTWVEYLDKEVK